MIKIPNYLDIIKLLLHKIQKNHPIDFKGLIGSISSSEKQIKALINEVGQDNSIIVLSDVLKEMIDSGLVKGTAVRVKPITNGGIEFFFSIERLSTQGLILIGKLNEKNFIEKLKDHLKKGVASTPQLIIKTMLDLMI